MQDQENNNSTESLEASQTTGGSTTGSSAGSTGDSTDLVEPIQPADLDDEPTVIEHAELEEISLMGDGSIEAKIKKYCPKCGAVLEAPTKQKGKGIYQRKDRLLHWTPEENQKIQDAKMRKQIYKFYTWFSFVKSERKKALAATFFSTEFPTRSPIAVYQKAWRIKNRKERPKVRIS